MINPPLFESILFVSGFIALLIIPGVFAYTLLFQQSTFDVDEHFTYGFALSLFIWFITSFFAFKYSFHAKYVLVIISVISMAGLGFVVRKQYSKYMTKPISTENLWFVIFSLLVSYVISYPAQFQESFSDAFAHLAAIRNAYSCDIVQNFDGILGSGHPSLNVYGCHPWVLALGLIFKLVGVDPALGFSSLVMLLIFILLMIGHTFFNIFIKDKLLSGALVILLCIIMLTQSIYKWGPSNYFFDPINNLVFPFHLASDVLNLVLVIFYAKFILSGNRIFVAFMLIVSYLIMRLHPVGIVWIPWITFFFVAMDIILIRKSSRYFAYFIAIIMIVCFVVFDLLTCKNTYVFDSLIQTQLSLWQLAGKNIHMMGEYYIYDPIVYLKDRGIYDTFAVLIFLGLTKIKFLNSRMIHHPELYSGVRVVGYLYLGILFAIYSIIFNPVATYVIVNFTHSSVPLYRAFLFFNVSSICFQIFLVVALLRIFFSRNFTLLTVWSSIILFVLFVYLQNESYIKKIYINSAHAFSTNSVYNYPLMVASQGIGSGRVAVDPSISTAIAALTDLDPIVAEAWRSASQKQYELDQANNREIISLSGGCNHLYKLLHKYNVRWIISSADAYASMLKNGNPNCSFLKLKVNTSQGSIWENISE